MLNAVAELAEYGIRNIGGVLRYEIHSHALAADEADNLLDLVHEGLGGVFEQGVSLVEEEHELGQFQVANFRQTGIDLGKQPEQEGGVELGVLHQLVGRQHAEDALAVVGLQQVEDVEGRLAEELVGSLALEAQQRPLDCAYRAFADVAVACTVLGRVVAHIHRHGPQVLEVEQKQALVVRYAEDYVHHAALHFVKAEQTAHEHGAHVADCGAHGMALLAEYVVEAHRAARELGIGDLELPEPFLDEAGQLPGLADAGEVALHVGHEAGHARLAESFRKNLQGNGFTRARGTCYESVTVGHFAAYRDGALLAMGHIQPAFFV